MRSAISDLLLHKRRGTAVVRHRYEITLQDKESPFPLVDFTGEMDSVKKLYRVLKNLMYAGEKRQLSMKNRSLFRINAYFEETVNAVRPSAIGFQQPVKDI